MRSASRLNGKLQAMIEKEGIDLGEEDASDMEDLMGEVDESVKAKKHFRCIFQYIFSFTKLIINSSLNKLFKTLVNEFFETLKSATSNLHSLFSDSLLLLDEER